MPNQNQLDRLLQQAARQLGTSPEQLKNAAQNGQLEQLVGGVVYNGQDWYFFNGGGHMVKDQWVEWKGKWYYLSSDGKMAFDTITPDGYRVDQDGVWQP